MRNFSKIIGFMLLATVANSKESLFMDRDESSAVLTHLKFGKHNVPDNDQIKKPYINAILYISETNWTVWINNIAYSTVGEKDGFSIDEVFEDSVVLTTPDGNTETYTVNMNGPPPKPEPEGNLEHEAQKELNCGFTTPQATAEN